MDFRLYRVSIMARRLCKRGRLSRKHSMNGHLQVRKDKPAIISNRFSITAELCKRPKIKKKKKKNRMSPISLQKSLQKIILNKKESHHKVALANYLKD